MKVIVQAKEMKVTEGIRGFVMNKSTQMLGKFGRRVIGVKVYLEKIVRKKSDTDAAKAKIEIETPGENIVVESSSFDPYHAIAGAIKAGARRVRKKKEKFSKRELASRSADSK
ncbi:MAG TPA: ribosome-associated translation inhibitor RaiA [Candidatus Woesebacteria bacterium]|nr:ribosome-associated translation inhibitor RaiA [Candidatus Woesebacteria bacterium]